MADAMDSKSIDLNDRVGSTPTFGTNFSRSMSPVTSLNFQF